MNGVILWVDKSNFKEYLHGNEFIGFNDQSTYENIQIIVPPTAIITYEESDDSYKFDCYRKELW